jgi:two-component sensor histidine kinase
VGSIAVVHETLSQTYDESVAFDEIVDHLAQMVSDVGAGEALITRQGSFAMLPAEVATPLAMALTELLQNALEHAFVGVGEHHAEEGGGGGRSAGRPTVSVQATRLAGRLRVCVEDNGVGLPAGFDPETTVSLGLSIVRTLVESELGGVLTLGSGAGGGTRAVLDLPVR